MFMFEGSGIIGGDGGGPVGVVCLTFEATGYNYKLKVKICISKISKIFILPKRKRNATLQEQIQVIQTSVHENQRLLMKSLEQLQKQSSDYCLPSYEFRGNSRNDTILNTNDNEYVIKIIFLKILHLTLFRASVVLLSRFIQIFYITRLT